MEKYKKRQGHLRAIVIILLLTGLVLAVLWWRQQSEPVEPPADQQEQEQTIRETVDRGFDEEGWEQMQEQIAEREAELEEVQENEDGVIGAHLRLGNSYYAAGELQKAVDQYNAILETHPNDPPALENKGQALMEMGDYYGAETAWRKALEIDPQEITYLKLNTLYQEHLTDRYADFGPMLEEAVANIGQTEGLMVALGNWHKAQGNIDRAISHYEVAVRLSDGDPAIQETLDELREERE